MGTKGNLLKRWFKISANLFEVLGRAVAYAETNSQSGCQRALEEIKTARSVILTFAASTGGRENRLKAASDMLSNMELTETQKLVLIEKLKAFLILLFGVVDAEGQQRNNDIYRKQILEMATEGKDFPWDERFTSF